jgi:hypothetical protein
MMSCDGREVDRARPINACPQPEAKVRLTAARHSATPPDCTAVLTWRVDRIPDPPAARTAGIIGYRYSSDCAA